MTFSKWRPHLWGDDGVEVDWLALRLGISTSLEVDVVNIPDKIAWTSVLPLIKETKYNVIGAIPNRSAHPRPDDPQPRVRSRSDLQRTRSAIRRHRSQQACGPTGRGQEGDKHDAWERIRDHGRTAFLIRLPPVDPSLTYFVSLPISR